MNTTQCLPGRPATPHRFRRSLPVRIRARLDAPFPELEPEVAAAMKRAALRSPPVNWRRLTAADVRDFLMAYCAAFVALAAFLL